MTDRNRDIERYLKGEMTSSERHAIEKAALNDPFLADALEGTEHSGHEPFMLDLKELQASIYSRTKRRNRPRTISLWNWSLGIAAGLIAIAISGVFIIDRISQKQEEREMAMLSNQSEEELQMIRESGSTDTMTLVLPERYQQTPPPRRSRRMVNPARIEAIAQNEIISSSGPQREVEVNLSEEPVIARTEARDSVIGKPPLSEEIVSAEKPSSGEVEALEKARAKRESSTADRKVASGGSETRKISGRVTSAEDGSGLPGVNVVVKGTALGAVTDATGDYELSMPADHNVLVFNFIGLKTLEKEVGGATAVDVKLEADYSELSEVVVTGSGVNRSSEEDTSLKFAEPQGGRRAFQNYLERQMQYPKQALDNKIEGKVTVQFTVQINGQLGDFEILKGIGYGCDDEVIRLIKQGPSWEPTKKGNRPITDKVKVRLKFDLPD